MKVAFVHDWLLGMRGGEKVLEAACELYPGSDIYTLLHDPERVSGRINQRVIRTSWLQRLPGIKRYYRYLLPLMPLAIREFDLGDYDLVLSFSHCVAKGARLGSGKPGKRPAHICYCFTPMRYIYYQFDNYFSDGSRGVAKRAARIFRPYLVGWDRKTTQSVDRFIACSENVRRRIKTTYGRDCEVIYPPVDTDFFTPATRAEFAATAANGDQETAYEVAGGASRIAVQERVQAASAVRGAETSSVAEWPGRGYYLVAGALVPYKRVDIAIEACCELKVPLKIVGVGTEENKLKELAAGGNVGDSSQPPVEFLGWRSGEELRDLYRNCEALLFPQEEDFGIAAIEAMACGRPVIAYKAGGALETVVDGKAGVLFGSQTPEALGDAIRRSWGMDFDVDTIRMHAEKFNRQNFKTRLAEFIEETMSKDSGRHSACP